MTAANMLTAVRTPISSTQSKRYSLSVSWSSISTPARPREYCGLEVSSALSRNVLIREAADIRLRMCPRIGLQNAYG